jgi:hypothetical protein
MSTKEKATEIFEFYYSVIPFAHTNKQRAEVALKCSLKLVEEVMKGYTGDFYSTKYWEEVQTILKSKIK